MKFVFCTIVASLLLIGCSSSGSDDDAPVTPAGETTNNNPFETTDDNPVDTTDDGPLDTTADDPVDSTDDSPVDTTDDDSIDIADDDPIDNPVSDIPSVEYMGSFISLRYPSSWLLNPNGQIAGVDVQFVAPQGNSFGGTDNCVFTTSFFPSLTLLETVDDLLELFDAVPEPQEEFLEVNGVPAARVTGNLSILTVQIPAIAQVMAFDGMQVLGICVGTDNEAFDLMLGSVTLN